MRLCMKVCNEQSHLWDQGHSTRCDGPLLDPTYIILFSMPRELVGDFNYMLQIRDFPEMLMGIKNIRRVIVYTSVSCVHSECIDYSEEKLSVHYHFRLKSWNNISGSMHLHCWLKERAEKGCVVLEDRLEIYLLRRLLMFRESCKQMDTFFFFAFIGCLFSDVQRISL